MGIILGALGGAGAQLADYGDKQITQDQAVQRMGVESNLALARAQTLEQFKADLANAQRGQMVSRVQGAAGEIADEQMAPKIAQEQAGITDPASWTPEQQAAVDQSNAIDRKGIVNQALQDGSAGLRSGDIAPEKAMENTSKLQINQVRMDSLLARAEDKNATNEQIAQVRVEAMRYGYELKAKAEEEKRLSGKIDTATGRMLITSEDANIKASTNQMQMLSRELADYHNATVAGPDGKRIPHPRIAEIQQQVEGLRQDIATSRANKQVYLQSMNLAGAGGPTQTVQAPGGGIPPGWSVRVK